MLNYRALRFVALELALCGVLLAVWSRLGIDDAYIFLAYARNLAKSGIFAFNPGEPSYGFSSPAWVLLLAGMSRITTIPVGVFLSNLLGVVLCVLSSLAAWTIWEEVGQRPSSRNLVFTSILFSGPWFFTVWFIFGMETGLAVVSIFGFLLWLVKVRAGAPRFPWLILGVISATVLALTRLESGLYIGVAVALTFLTSRSRRNSLDLFAVVAIAGTAELAWLLYAHTQFGTYMPWTSTARLIYYLPTSFAAMTGDQYYHLGFGGRVLLALKACIHILFGGLMKILLLVVPIAAAAFFLRSSETLARWKPMATVATAGLLLQITLFAFLFPLAQNRHLIPYIAALWVLVAPAIAGAIERTEKPVRAVAFVAVAMLWIAGAALYRREGISIEPLHQMAAALRPGDRVGAEPIGIIAFDAPVQVLDLGGLTDRDSWPLLMHSSHLTPRDIIAWDLGKGATRLILDKAACDARGHIYGGYCLADADEAHRILQAKP